MGAESRLRSLGIDLPEPPKPVASYVPFVREGNLLFVSGQLPLLYGRPVRTGRLGDEVTIDQGRECSRQCALNALAVARSALGSLDKVKRVLKVTAYVASTPDFSDHPQVANGASDLLLEVFSEAGRHARAAVGVSSLPLGSPVEVEVLFGV